LQKQSMIVLHQLKNKVYKNFKFFPFRKVLFQAKLDFL
jgi:hypothetical protein